MDDDFLPGRARPDASHPGRVPDPAGDHTGHYRVEGIERPVDPDAGPVTIVAATTGYPRHWLSMEVAPDDPRARVSLGAWLVVAAVDGDAEG